MKDLNKHSKTPFLTALEEYANSNVGPFDVPGHHMGNINNDFLKLMGSHLLKMDVNAPRGLDNLSHPEDVIKEASILLSDLYDSDLSYFLINGTTVGIIAMIMATTKAEEKIIIPRNIHKSIISGLVLSGAAPVFVKPIIDDYLGISNNASYEGYENAILENLDAKTVLIINPTYFGVVSDIKRIVDLAHHHQMTVIVDEAHGAHLHFHDQLPLSAMQVGADICASSFHKTCGSLTQSSILLVKGKRINPYLMQKTLNLLQTTSPSALLIASCDATRKHLALYGFKELTQTLEHAKFLREQINLIPGVFAVDKEYFISKENYSFDETKLIIKIDKLKLSGFELYQILKDEYNIQLELGETKVVLAVLTIGTTKEHCLLLIDALREISKKYYHEEILEEEFTFDFDYPNYLYRPRMAYHSPQKKVHIDDSLGMICAESIMIYPPGIPLIIPGEEISLKLINRIKYLKKQKTKILSDFDDLFINVVDEENWEKGREM